MRCARALWVAAAASLLAGGCASPGKPVTQTVQVETPGCAQATCELSNDRGSWQVPRTPGSVSVTTSTAPLRVSCRADEGARGSAGTPSTVAPATGAGAVAGGVAGGVAVGAAVGATALSFIPVLGVIAVLGGAAVGAATGQMAESHQQALRYPAVISIPMNCAQQAGPALAPALGLGLGIRGMPPAEARAAGLGERSAVLVTRVAPGGPAAAAGLQPGDILLDADGQDLGDAAQLEERVLALAPGASLLLRLRRGDMTLERVLTRPPAAP
jgi:hypothetical protein